MVQVARNESGPTGRGLATRVRARRHAIGVGVLAATLTAVWVSPAQAWYGSDARAGAGTAARGTAVCGTRSLTQSEPVYQHVVVIMDENVSYGQLAASGSAPYLKGVADACGSELDMHAATHPSEPNYLAATSGDTSRQSGQAGRSNIFFQAQAAGLTWRNYVESMPGPCTGASAPRYKSGHNPALYYSDLRRPSDSCRANDVPLTPALDAAIAADDLPSYAWISPDVCDDMHWADACPYPRSERIARGDQWLSALLPRIFATPSYRAGRTLVIVTFDEGAGGSRGVDCTDPAYYPAHPDCHIATVLASAYVRPGSVGRSDQNLYSLLGTTEDLLGLPRLGRAVGQPSMRADLGF